MNYIDRLLMSGGRLSVLAIAFAIGMLSFTLLKPQPEAKIQYPPFRIHWELGETEPLPEHGNSVSIGCLYGNPARYYTTEQCDQLIGKMDKPLPSRVCRISDSLICQANDRRNTANGVIDAEILTEEKYKGAEIDA